MNNLYNKFYIPFSCELYNQLYKSVHAGDAFYGEAHFQLYRRISRQFNWQLLGQLEDQLFYQLRLDEYNDE